MAEGGWSDAEIASIAVKLVGAEEGEWTSGPWIGSRARSLGLAEASAGLLGAYELRSGAHAERPSPASAGPPTQQSQPLDLQYLYVHSGSITLREGDGTQRTLAAGDALHRTRRSTALELLALSDDLDAYEVTAPARAAQWRGDPGRAGADGGDGAIHDEPGERNPFVLGAGPRKETLCRRTGVSETTGGRYRIHYVRAPGAVEKTDIWHYHDMAQWFVVLDGWARIEVDGGFGQVVRPGDSVCIGAGRRCAHNVPDISDGYTILEVCVPAEYGTWLVDPAENPHPRAESHPVS